jgi:diaminohydroxyphosphoribosylaminopyrimidine deaminase/5-amino-6-(5-phosphoribosylamino)uracil reductase
VPPTGFLFDPALASTLVITSPAADPEVRRGWKESGAEVEEIPLTPAAGPGQGGVDLQAALELLGRRGILQAMVEGGATLHGALLGAGLVDRIVVYVGGAVLGAEGLPVFAGPGPATLEEASRWRLAAVRQVGSDARLDWEPVQPRN